MPKIKYVGRRFNATSQQIIDQANTIIAEYTAQGYNLTLRQLYYQFVSRDYLPNSQQSYKRLGSIINDARLAGLIDWDCIEDRTRGLEAVTTWDSPAEIVEACANQFKVDKWAKQPYYPECFPPDTLVTTPHGQTCIGSVAVGDTVVSGNGNWNKVTRIFQRRYDGELVHILAAGVLPIRCTPEHPVWCLLPDASTKYKGAEHKFLPAEYVRAVDLPKHGLLRIPRFLTVGDVTTVTLPRTRQREAINVPVDEAFLRFLGFYLAEGCVKGDQRTVQLTFGESETVYAEEVERWAESVDINHFNTDGEGTLVVYLCSAALAKWLLEQFGTGSHIKSLPGWVLTLPQEKQLTLLKAYFQGDEHFKDVSRSAVVLTTFSEHLALSTQRILWRCGYAASLDRICDKTEWRYRCSVGGAAGESLAEHWGFALPPKGLERSKCYNHILLDDHFVYLPVRGILLVDYHGDVCNLEVDNEHTYIATVDVHNCWIEKEALAGVFERICRELRVPYLSCRGYTSQSEMWRAGRRLKQAQRRGQIPIIYHFGDHDPSGINMGEDIQKRLDLFMGGPEFHRLALNMDQVEQYNPPPNPAKETDARFRAYRDQFGDESWELDALEPTILSNLVREAIEGIIDQDAWDRATEEENKHRRLLGEVSRQWTDLTENL